MFTLNEVSKSYGSKTLFEDVTVTINRTDRLGLVGPNGAGKSTLFKLILGQEEADSGTISRQRGATVGFLPQESAPAGEETVLEVATSHHHGDEWRPIDGVAVAKAKRILKGLSFRETDFDRPARELSGGWVMRTHLARLLVQEPDLLMLDEPTNHLDLETLIWFQEYLRAYPGGIVLISHDREFLNKLVTGILELRIGKLFGYTGNYDTFLEQRDAQQVQQAAAFKNQQKEIGKLMDFVNKFRAKASTATRAQAKLKQIERMERVDAPEAEAAVVDFAFPQPTPSGHRVITLRQAHFAYGEHVIYRGIDFETTRGERTVFVGPNGAGKSTLLKMLAGVLTLTGGERDLGPKAQVGYYSQYRTEMLRVERTVLEEALDTPARVTELYVRSLLGCFLFRDDEVFKKVGVLSGGEKSRLALVKILLNPPNLLLMDEPTTHLDMASIDALIAALTEYTGTLLFISHDVYFIRALATRVLHINAGRLTPYAGDYDYYLEKTKAISARTALTAQLTNGRPTNVVVAPVNRAEAARPTQKDRRQQAAEARKVMGAQKKRVTLLETEISNIEKRIVDLTAELELPATYAQPRRVNEINQLLKQATADLERRNGEWEAAAEKLSELETTAAAG
jgi:ATP-binding cassette subfamily F protein 3